MPTGIGIALALVVALTATSAGAQDDSAMIRSARATSNAAIARHDAAAAVAVVREDVQVIASGGTLVPDRLAMRAAFERSFADPNFVTFVRTPQQIEVARDRTTAAEQGQWTGRWKTPCGPRLVTGRYLARWAKSAAGWQIAAELFIPLRQTGDCLKR